MRGNYDVDEDDFRSFRILILDPPVMDTTVTAAIMPVHRPVYQRTPFTLPIPLLAFFVLLRLLCWSTAFRASLSCMIL